jgi:Tfp pilus assembly protein PilX
MKSFVGKIAKKSSQAGFVMVAVMMLGLVLSITTVTSLFTQRTDSRVSGNFERTAKVFMAADTAVAQAKANLSTWLQSQQSAGSLVYFNNVLSAAAANNGYLLTSGNTGQSMSNMSIAGNTVGVKVSDDSDANSAANSDSNRTIVITSTATGPTGEAVTIMATLMAPTDSANGGNVTLPTTAGASVMCGDYRKQTVSLKNDAVFSGFNHNLPADPNCVGVACKTPSLGAVGAVAGSTMTDSGKHRYDLKNSAVIEGSPATNLISVASSQCASWSNFVSQVNQLRPSSYVVHVRADDLDNADIGSRTNPKVIIITGANAGSTRNITITKEVSMYGIIIFQSDANDDDSLRAVINKGFKMEGLVVMNGDANTKLRLKKNSAIFGSTVLLSEDDETEPASNKGKIKFEKDSFLYYSTQALDLARRAVTGANDAAVASCNTGASCQYATTVAWREIY